jgi:hypothetical protein
VGRQIKEARPNTTAIRANSLPIKASSRLMRAKIKDRRVVRVSRLTEVRVQDRRVRDRKIRVRSRKAAQDASA